jgi:hypothetical protein
MSIVPPQETGIRQACQIYKAATEEVMRSLGVAGHSCKDFWSTVQATPIEKVSDITRLKLATAVAYREFVARRFERRTSDASNTPLEDSHWRFLCLLKSIDRFWKNAATAARHRAPSDRPTAFSMSLRPTGNRFEVLHQLEGDCTTLNLDPQGNTPSDRACQLDIGEISAHAEALDRRLPHDQVVTSEDRCDLILELLEISTSAVEFVRKTCQEFLRGEVDYITLAMGKLML